jgi:O-antigen/teichoic acid export membrane protein
MPATSRSSEPARPLSSDPAESCASTDSAGFPTHNLAWRIFSNTATQVGGRGLVTLSRLVMAAIIVRGFGKEIFGGYSLVLTLLFIGEWLLDFGTTDVFIREICREPENRMRLMRILAASKLVQIPIAFSALAVILFALRYPAQIVQAGCIGGVSMVFFAGVLCYRVVFKANLAIHFEVAAELASVLAMIGMVWLVARAGGNLSSIFGCYVVSRAVFFAVCFLLGKNRYRPSFAGVSIRDIGWGLRSSTAIGTIGFLVVLYETIDLLLLSRLGGLSDVASYSAAQRFIWPILTAVSAIGGTIYPVAASYWPRDRQRFEEAAQRGLEAGAIFAGLSVCPIVAGATFFLGLLGSSLISAAPVLQVLAFVCLVKAFASTISPLLYVVHAQRQALHLLCGLVALKAGVVAIMSWRFGAMGVACGALTVDIFSAAASVYLLKRYSGYSVRWQVPLKVFAIVLIPVLVIARIGITGFMAPVLAVTLYCSLVFLSGAVRLSEIRSLVKRKGDLPPAIAE